MLMVVTATIYPMLLVEKTKYLFENILMYISYAYIVKILNYRVGCKNISELTCELVNINIPSSSPSPNVYIANN